MASKILKRKAEERAKKIDKEFSKGTYGSTADLKQKTKATKKTSSTGKSSSAKSGGAKTDKSSISATEKSRSTTKKPTNYSSAVKYLQDKGHKYAAGIMTESEWRRRNKTGTYQDYLDSMISKYDKSANVTTENTKPENNTTKKLTDFNTETNNAYASVKNKVSEMTTITSNMTEDERKARIKEINSELYRLKKARSGLERAKLYGGVGNLITENESRQAELSKELRELERVGTFSASELKQFEIDDANEKVVSAQQKVASYGQRPSAESAEAYRQAVSEQYKAQNEVDVLKRQKKLYDDIEEFGYVSNKDDFVGQWKANYRSNELSREADKAISRYLDNPTEENKEIAYAYDAFAKEYMKNNEKALDDENVKASWLTKSMAGYLPQFKDQILPEVLGGGVGLILGTAAGAPTVGMSAGAGLATGIQSYTVMRGSVYRTLLAEGVDEETALQAANDEALISALIEGGETAASVLMAGGGKAINAISGAAKASVAKGSTNAATKFLAGMATKSATKATTKAATKAVADVTKPLWRKGLGVAFDVAKQGASEYLEEFTQGAVSRANREQALATVEKEIGQYGEGNIDLYDRPIYKNSDGTISTVDSVTLQVDDKFVVLPSIVRDENGNAKRLESDDEIFAHYENTGEYLGEFDTLEEANGYATKLHSAQSYYYDDKTGNSDDNLWLGGAKVVGDAVFGGNTEALKELHEQGAEGLKIGLMFGGTNATVNNIVTHYANAKTVKLQNEVVDTILEDEESLDTLIEEGKASGTGTVSERIATEIETARANGEEITRAQIKQLIESNEVYIKAEKATAEPDTLEQAAIDVVAERNRTSTPIYERLEAQSQDNEPIAVEDVKKATGFGDSGAELIADYSNVDGTTFSQIEAEVKPSYWSGFNNPDLDVKKMNGSFYSEAQKDAYRAGQIDRKMQDLFAKEHAKNVVINKESGFNAENLPSDVTQSQVETLDLMAKALGVKSYITKGLKGNAELNKATGEVPIDFKFEREIGTGNNKQKVSIIFHAAHEMALHRVVELAPEEGSAFVYAMYNHLAGNDTSNYTLAEQKRSAYAEQGVEISLAKAMEEVSANNILYLYNNNEAKFKNAIERIANGTDTKAKQGLRKYIDYLNRIIRKIRDFLIGKSPKQRAEIQAELSEITRLRDMFEKTFAKAVENAKTIQTKSSENLEIDANGEYNGNVNYSLKGKGKKSEQYGVMWTLDKGVLNNSEVSAFYEKISETKNNKYLNYHKAADGQLIYEIGNKLIYTDGDYDYPHISKVFTINTNNNYWLEYGMECFYEGEQYGHETDTIIETVEAVLGEGAVETATYSSYETDKRSRKSRDERTDSTEANRGSQKDVGDNNFTSYSLKDSEDKRTLTYDSDDILDKSDIISYVPITRVKMKVFPPYNESKSDANEWATRWAHRDDVDTGAQTLVFYHNRCYVIGKYDSADLKYQIEGRISYNVYESIRRELEEDARNREKQRQKKMVDFIRERNERRDTDAGRGQSFDYSSVKYGREDTDVLRLDRKQNGERGFQGDSSRSDEYDSEDRKTKGINESKNYSLKEKETAYTDEEYRAFGWARANDILTSGQNADYRSKFAMVKSGQAKFPKSKSGEYIIPVSDIYDSTFEGINNVLVFAKGTIANPVITSVIEIYEYDETSLDIVRRQIYDGERRGIQQETGELFGRYFASDFELQPNQQREGVEGVRNSGDNGYGERGSGEASSIEEGLSESKSYSLKNEYWKTDLTKSQLKTVEGWLRQTGNPEATRITDTANWYKGRINGKDLFVIYSTVYANDPTILYEVKGGNANIERDILMDLLEVIENGESTIGIQRNIDRLLSGDWVQEKHDMANNDVGSRGRGSNTGYASVLQGKSSNFTGSQAFRNVIRNLFEIQEKSVAGDGKEEHSLKGTVVEGELASLVEKYGAIPRGEKSHRDIQVPKKTAKDKKVAQTVRTILEAKATPDEAIPSIEKMVEDGVFSYDVYTDKQAIKESEDYLEEYGWVESLNDWIKDVEKGIVTKQHTAMGWALYNNAVNISTSSTSETERATAIKTSLDILDAMVRHQRNAAQALQATRILKKLSPETQLYGVQKSVSAFQKELVDKYGDKAPNLKIDEELAEQFLRAETEDERLAVEIEIYKDIGRQMPSVWVDKWSALRYIGMLGNLRTHGRNILGNAFFSPVVIAKDLTATAIESIVAPIARWSGKEMVRGKALVWGSKADRALLKAAWNDYSSVADIVSNGGKYNEFAMANKYIEEGRKIFRSKLFAPVERVRKENSKALEKEDVWFSKPHYAYALAQYCKANNITAEQIKNGRAIAPARDYAIKEAQKATYKDTNAFSQMVGEWGKSSKGEKNVVKKAFNTVVEGILPFRKTPANILVRGVEYSPLGLIKGLSYDLYQVSKGKMLSSEAIDNISAGLTGTGLLALGVYLAAQGLVRGHGEDEEKEKEFNELMGHQAYALELPNGKSITLDWLAPEALPFFVGVNIWEMTRGTDEEVNLSTILQAVSRISEPMLEMSCLQSLNDLFESIGYATSNDTSGLVSVLSSAITSYLMQAVPTLLGQAERTGEKYRMTTYTEKDSFFTKDMQYAIGKISSKIPFWDYNQIPYIDAWGRKEASGTALKRGLNNFLNPAYTSTIESSEMENELLRLYESTGENSVFPTRADKYFTVDGVRKDLTAEEYVRYATLKGEKSYKAVKDLVESNAYRKLTDSEKVKAIEEAYDYANQKAKQAISNYKVDAWVDKADDFGSNVGSYLSFRTEVSNAKEENDGKISKQEVVDIIVDMAQNDAETWKMYLSMYDSNNDMYAYNKGIGGEKYMYFLETLNEVDRPTESGKYGTYTQEEAKRAVLQLDGLSRQEKTILWQSVNTSWKAKNNPFG